MAQNIVYSDPQRSAPSWMGDFAEARDAVMPFGLKLDVASFLRRDAVIASVFGVGVGAQGGIDEVQTVTVDATGGTFTLTYAGQTTAPIAEAATGATVQAALEALSNIIGGDIKVYGAAGGPHTVVFGGSLGKKVIAAMTADGALLTGGAGTVVIATTVEGAPGETSIPVTALSGPIPSGTVLDFGGNGRFAKLTAAAALGATALVVEALAESLSPGDAATYEGSLTKAKNILSGTLVGRTYAERDANTAYGPAASSDDEIYLLAFEIENTDVRDEGEAYRHGRLVKENYLPGWAALSAELKAVIRARYQTTSGIN